MGPSYVTGPRPDLPYVDTFSAGLRLSDVDKAMLSHCIETYTMLPTNGQSYGDFQDVLRAHGHVQWQTVVAILAQSMERILQENAANEAIPAKERTIVIEKYAQAGAAGILGLLVTAKGVQEKVLIPLSSKQWEILTGCDPISFERVVANVTAHMHRELEAQPSR